MACMWNASHGLMHFNAWSPAGSSVLRSPGTSGTQGLAGEHRPLLERLGRGQLALLCFLTCEDMRSFSHIFLLLECPCFPNMMDWHLLRPWFQINSFLLVPVKYFVIVMRKVIYMVMLQCLEGDLRTHIFKQFWNYDEIFFKWWYFIAINEVICKHELSHCWSMF